MLKPKEIRNLRLKLTSFADSLREAAANGNNDKRDQELAALIGTPGWDLVENYFEILICELLTPEQFEGSAEAYAVIGQAKLVSINALQEIVDSVKAASDRMKAAKLNQSSSETSE